MRIRPRKPPASSAKQHSRRSQTTLRHSLVAPSARRVSHVSSQPYGEVPALWLDGFGFLASSL